MGRYRPPQPKSSPYITPEGLSKLQAEQKSIWQLRNEVTAAVSAAAAEGDRSENAEYIYRKKQLREIDRRIRYLQKRLPDLKVVSAVANRDQVFFGASVELLNEADEIFCFRIVGADEIDPGKGYISIDSPVSRALIKKRIGDEVDVKVGEKVLHYEVTGISYGDL